MSGWVEFDSDDGVPVGERVKVRLKRPNKRPLETFAVYEQRGTVTAWWMDNGEPTGLYNVISFCRLQ